MPTLNDYLGGLFSSITDARVMADVQTVQVAEQYAKHDLLKHFAVPRMRISDIELTIPVAIEGLSQRSEFQLDPIGNAEFKRIMTRELANSVGYSELPPVPAQRLQSALTERTTELVATLRAALERAFGESKAGPAADLPEEQRQNAFSMFAKEIVSDLFKIGEESGLHDGTFPEGYSFDKVIQRTESLCNQLVKTVVDKPVLDQLSVIAESHRLREQRPEDVIRIRMTVGESGMEWQTLQRDDGSIERKLLPE